MTAPSHALVAEEKRVVKRGECKPCGAWEWIWTKKTSISCLECHRPIQLEVVPESEDANG